MITERRRREETVQDLETFHTSIQISLCRLLTLNGGSYPATVSILGTYASPIGSSSVSIKSTHWRMAGSTWCHVMAYPGNLYTALVVGGRRRDRCRRRRERGE